MIRHMLQSVVETASEVPLKNTRFCSVYYYRNIYSVQPAEILTLFKKVCRFSSLFRPTSSDCHGCVCIKVADFKMVIFDPCWLGEGEKEVIVGVQDQRYSNIAIDVLNGKTFLGCT